MIEIPRLIDKPVVQTFIRKASEHGFTKGDILWCLRELRKDYLIESRLPGPHPGLIIDILKRKTESMVEARRIVEELCPELGIKTEKT